MTPFTGSGELLLTRNSTTRVQTKKNYLFFLKKSNSLLFSLFSLFSLFALGKPFRTTFYAKTRCEVRALSRLFVCLCIYAKRFITYARNTISSPRVYVNVSVSRCSRVAAFFLSHQRFCARFSSFSLCYGKKWERKKLRALCLFSSERKTRKCSARKKRGSRSINISLARYDGACCVLSSSAYCGLGRRFMHHHARRKTTKETYFGCLTDQKNSLSIFNLTAKWKKKRTRRLKRKRRKMRMRSK